MTYHREEAEKIIKINREQLNISDEQTALAYAINCGKGEEMDQALRQRMKQKSLFGIFRSSGESLIDILERVCRSESTSEHELTLDEKSAENGKKKTADEWIKYWNKIKRRQSHGFHGRPVCQFQNHTENARIGNCWKGRLKLNHT